MSTNHTETAAPDALDTRLRSLERANARWRGAAVALLAGGVGLLVGGMAQPRNAPPPQDQTQEGYQYVAVGESIYRIDKYGRISYLNVVGGLRSADGYYSWGRFKIDPERSLLDRP